MNSFSISTVIITKNEERNIDDCLMSVKWVDEIIVVDAESTDRTQELARSYTSQVFVRPWEGYGRQKTLVSYKPPVIGFWFLMRMSECLRNWQGKFRSA